jgi:hypothetical protein
MEKGSQRYDERRTPKPIHNGWILTAAQARA